jgi:hypothetical protein
MQSYVGFEVLTAAVMKSTIFWDITPPCSPLRAGPKNTLSKNPALLATCWFIAQLIFLTLQMEAICSSETSIDTQQTTLHYIPEDGTLHIQSYIQKITDQLDAALS